MVRTLVPRAISDVDRKLAIACLSESRVKECSEAIERVITTGRNAVTSGPHVSAARLGETVVAKQRLNLSGIASSKISSRLSLSAVMKTKNRTRILKKNQGDFCRTSLSPSELFPAASATSTARFQLLLIGRTQARCAEPWVDH